MPTRLPNPNRRPPPAFAGKTRGAAGRGEGMDSGFRRNEGVGCGG